MTRIVLFVPDLGDRSRVQAVVGELGEVDVVRTVDSLVEAATGAEVVVVDLERDGVAEVLAELVGVADRVVGFGPHVDADLLRAAEGAGVATYPALAVFADIRAAVVPA